MSAETTGREQTASPTSDQLWNALTLLEEVSGLLVPACVAPDSRIALTLAQVHGAVESLHEAVLEREQR